MRKMKYNERSKKGMTLVEMIVAMALTSIFLASCVVLILPVERIYTEVDNSSRAQLLADTVVNSLRAECSGAYITSPTDVRVVTSGASGTIVDECNVAHGNTLIVRKTASYFATISSNYNLSQTHKDTVLANDPSPLMNSTTSRSVYRMTFVSDPPRSDSAHYGHLHYGYLNVGAASSEANPSTWVPYDFTNPLISGAYGDFLVAVEFGSVVNGTDGLPAYVNCTVRIMDKDNNTVYTRQTVLCFT